VPLTQPDVALRRFRLRNISLITAILKINRARFEAHETENTQHWLLRLKRPLAIGPDI
jgi:hypothetical protein